MPKRGEKVLLKAAPFLAALLLKLLRLTLRFRYVDRPDLDEGNYIFAFWHGRMLMMPFAKPEGPVSVMVSRHRDGELISRTVAWFGIDTTRGSTSKGGSSALRSVIKLARNGCNIVFTPDGPRGPKYVAQSGIIQAASATGLPIYPVTYGARKKKP